MKRLCQIILVMMFFFPLLVYAAVTGFTNPTSNGGGSTCTNSPNALISDNVYTTCTNAQLIDVATFNFAITNGSTIDGIEVGIEWSVSKASTYQLDCRLLDATGSPVGNTKTVTTASLTDVTDILGAGSDMWGTTLGESDVENANFGVRCTATNVTSTPGAKGQIDLINIQITYTTAGRRRIIVVD